MYKKKSKAPMIATVAVLVVVFMLLIGVNVMRNRANNVEPQTEPETETPVHNLVLYKSSDASMEFDEGWLKSDGDEEAILEIAEDAFVTIRVTPKEGKDLDKVDIMDYELKKLEYYVLDGENREKRVNFVMPKKDMVVNMTFVSDDKDADKDKDSDVDESETSGMPYNLTLHGLTTDIIMSYNGQFDDHDFLQQFGDSLHIDSARSEYSDVTDITFSTRPYEGEQDSDKVYHYIYLNGNVNRELLATFYSKEGKYVFTKAEDMEEASDQPETEAAPVQTSGNGSNTGNNNGNGTSTQTTGGSTPGTSYTEEGTSVSFDILKVSQNLCDFCGGKDKFYDEAWEYVLSKKLTGQKEYEGYFERVTFRERLYFTQESFENWYMNQNEYQMSTEVEPVIVAKEKDHKLAVFRRKRIREMGSMKGNGNLEYLSVVEAAFLAGVHQSAIVKNYQSGKLPCVQTGMVIRIAKKDFNKWMKAREKAKKEET